MFTFLSKQKKRKTQMLFIPSPKWNLYPNLLIIFTYVCVHKIDFNIKKNPCVAMFDTVSWALLRVVKRRTTSTTRPLTTIRKWIKTCAMCDIFIYTWNRVHEIRIGFGFVSVFVCIELRRTWHGLVYFTIFYAFMNVQRRTTCTQVDWKWLYILT